MENNKLVPPQEEGKQVDLSEKKDYQDGTAAMAAFRLACDRLLHPQQWHELTGKASATFEVFDTGKNKTERTLQQGDYLRIDIPGPGSPAGEGFDWVRVDAIDGESESASQVGIKLVPCANPMEKEDTTAHFFEEGSSSTLIVALLGNAVEVMYKGRNEVINNETGKVADNVRNTVVGAGAKAGLSEAQWTELIKSFLNE